MGVCVCLCLCVWVWVWVWVWVHLGNLLKEVNSKECISSDKKVGGAHYCSSDQMWCIYVSLNTAILNYALQEHAQVMELGAWKTEAEAQLEQKKGAHGGWLLCEQLCSCGCGCT
jgi:hypothetical protein